MRDRYGNDSSGGKSKKGFWNPPAHDRAAMSRGKRKFDDWMKRQADETPARNGADSSPRFFGPDAEEAPSEGLERGSEAPSKG